MMRRPPREDYVRVSVESDGHCFEPAVEWRAGDVFASLVAALKLIARVVGANPGDPMERAQAIGKAIRNQWPDRAYFVETWPPGGEGFAQSVQPYGFPRNRDGR